MTGKIKVVVLLMLLLETPSPLALTPVISWTWGLRGIHLLGNMGTLEKDLTVFFAIRLGKLNSRTARLLIFLSRLLIIVGSG